MTAYIFINGEVITVTEAMHRFAEQESKKKDEQRRKSYDDFGSYLR